MSFLGLDSAVARPGQIACICGPEGEAEGAAQASLVWRLAAGFGLSVLAQALILATLPLAATTIAPSARMVGWPFALTLLGAAVASLPASFLLDLFGRRAAFALGASFGVAGGALLAWSILERRFPGLCLGAFWLGLAQGFGLFYRHAAALGAASRARSATSVFAGGCLAALAAPALLQSADVYGGPLAPVWSAGFGALLYLVALPLAMSLPHAIAAAAAPGAAARWQRLAGATAIGALAWFGMGHAMSSAPLAMADCGAGAATIGGIVSLHLLAMYAPAAFAAGLLARLPTMALSLGGLGLLACGLALQILAPGLAASGAGLVLAGIGWSLANAGEMGLLHESGSPSAPALAGHDVALLLAALAGAVFI
jgi:MFS family permease